MSRPWHFICVIAFLIFPFLTHPSAASANTPRVWVIREIVSFSGETVTAGPKAVTTVGGDVYLAVVTHKPFKENRFYILHSAGGLSWDGGASPVYTYGTAVDKACHLDFLVTAAGFHLVWEDTACAVRHLFVSHDGRERVPTEITASGGQPVLVETPEGVRVYYLQRSGFGYYPKVVSRNWLSGQHAWTGEVEALAADPGYSYSSLSAAVSTSGQVYLSAVHYVFAGDYEIQIADPSGSLLRINTTHSTATATAAVRAGSQVEVFWGEESGDTDGQLSRWSKGQTAPVTPAVVATNKVSARYCFGQLHLIWYDVSRGRTGAIKYTFTEGENFREPIEIAFWGDTSKFSGLDIAFSAGAPLLFWAADKVVKQHYPVTEATVTVLAGGGRELPAVRYYYYPGAAQNNVLRLKVVPDRPLPGGIYADLSAVVPGGRINGTSEDGGCTCVIEGPFPPEAGSLRGLYPIVVRDTATGTEIVRFEAGINIMPDLTEYHGDTTDWTAIEDFTNAGITIHRVGRAKIELNGLDLTTASVNEIVYLGDHLDFSRPGVVAFDAEALPSFRNKPGRVTIFGLPYTSVPDILVNGRPAGDLVGDVSYVPPGPGTDGTLSFQTVHFSTFAAVPRVKVDSPVDGATLQEPQCAVQGSVNDPGATVHVVVNGVPFTTCAGSQGEWALTVPLEEGENLLTVTAAASIADGLVSLPQTLRLVCLRDGGGDDGDDGQGEDPPADREEKVRYGHRTGGRAVPDPGTGDRKVDPGAARPYFYDLTGHWAREVIEDLAARGLVRGAEPGRFVPDRPITRAELVALLLRLLQIPGAVPAQATFTDVPPGKWFYAPVEAAHRAGLVTGRGGGRFAPHAPVTRQEMAVLLLRVLERAGADTLPGVGEQQQVLGRFVDNPAVASWARQAVAAVTKLGVVQGRPDRTFGPEAGTTRAEAAVVIFRLGKMLGFIQ